MKEAGQASTRITRRAFIGAAASVLAAPRVVLAQTQYPTRPIRFIMPYGPGSSTDAVARFLLERVTEEIGQPFVFENVAGASGVIGTRRIAGSPPDGYTVGLASSTTSALMSLAKDPGFDAVSSFAYVGGYGLLPYSLITSPSLPAKTLDEFITHVRANPGKLTAGWYTASARYCVAQLKHTAKLEVVEVPFTGVSQVLTEIQTGRLDFAFVPPDVAIAQSAGGTVKLLAVSTSERWPAAPAVPTLSESFPGLVMVSWVGVIAPTGTPEDILSKLEGSFRKVLEKAEVRERMLKFSYQPLFMPRKELPDRVRKEVVEWAAFVKEAGIQPQ